MRGLVIVAALFAAGCGDSVICGEGTIDVNGVCELSANAGNASCGAATRWDEGSETCVGVDVRCDEESTYSVEETGRVVCYGNPGDGPTIVCPSAEPDRVTVCGRIYDAETLETWDRGVGELCDPDNPAADGACALTLAATDSSSVLPYDELRMNDRGYFAFTNLVVPANGRLTLTATDAGSGDTAVPSINVLAVEAGRRYYRESIYVMRRETDAAWTSSAGSPFGSETLSDRGLVLAQYSHFAEPRPYVTAAVDDATVPDDDFYFEEYVLARGNVDPARDSTSHNGVALLIGVGASAVGGNGGAISPCVWPNIAVDGEPGTVHFVHVESVEPTSWEVCQ